MTSSDSRTGNGRLRCVIFDIDGTLTRTNELIFESFNHVAEKYSGKRMTPAEIIALFGPPEEGGLAKVVGGERVERAMDDLCAYYTRHHDRLASLHEGIDDVLRYLSDRGVTLAIFTGKGRRTAMITLEALHIDKYFDMIVSGSDVERHKPHHEGIVKVIESYGLDPAEVMMVGDAVSDVMASRAAGSRSRRCCGMPMTRKVY